MGTTDDLDLVRRTLQEVQAKLCAEECRRRQRGGHYGECERMTAAIASIAEVGWLSPNDVEKLERKLEDVQDDRDHCQRYMSRMGND